MFAVGKNKGRSETKIITLGGKEMSYDEDEDGFFIIRNSRGDIHQRMSANKFIETVQNSSNKVIYEGREY